MLGDRKEIEEKVSFKMHSYVKSNFEAGLSSCTFLFGLIFIGKFAIFILHGEVQ